MEKRIIDLEIIDDLEGSGVDAIALVDSPAIEKNFMYFKAEEFVEPQSGESESDYMGRCVPTLIDEGKPQDQAVAICISTYQNMGKQEMGIDTGGLAPYTNQAGPLKRKAVLGEEFAAEEYPTIEEAVKRSNELGLKGEIHSHATDNGFIYMPGASHADLEKAIANKEGFASVDELSVGDAVSWKTADKNPRGRITEIVKGAKKVPGVDFEIQGTEEDPGYIIEIYEELDGKWEASGKYVGRKADSILKNVELAEDRTVGTYGFAKMLFADEDKKEIVAIAMVPTMEIPRKDKDGNIYFVRFSKEVIAKIAEKYMREQRLADTNIQHVDTANAGAYVFESWIVETADDKANSVYGLDAPIGSWCVKMRVTNLETWAKVKSGELKGLSIQGDFLDKNEYEAYMKDRKMYSDLINLVKTL